MSINFDISKGQSKKNYDLHLMFWCSSIDALWKISNYQRFKIIFAEIAMDTASQEWHSTVKYIIYIQ